ncbi:glycosyltransferase [Mangrovimicrobium sediminis]|uniref:Glycosyltransferase n=1 Tax=Mangrovimicrobium sediminis TaxID=2562682 RepID=A0A4Z0M8D1_9GAMM|nr:glycosyltransferase [Haliea sp. SAOS-164]TGD75660.1 glycosyltransferase [Haliea sp. SAOS-164]
MNKSLVSIIIPAYNYGHFIEQAVDSALAQSWPHTEVVVVDDGSTDDTADRVDAYGARVRYYRQENAGLPAARNAGMDLARGDYLQFLDADDWLDPRCIERKIDALEANPQAVFCCCRTHLKMTTGSLTQRLRHRLLAGWTLPEAEELEAALCFANIAPPHAWLVRADAARNVGLRFDTTLKACEDYDFWLRLLAHYGPPCPAADAFVHYRVHDGSMSGNRPNQLAHDLRMLELVATVIEARHPVPSRARFDCLQAQLCASLRLADLLQPLASDQVMTALGNDIDKLVGELHGCAEQRDGRVHFYTGDARIFLARMSAKVSGYVSTPAPEISRLLACGQFASAQYLTQKLRTRQFPRYFLRLFYRDLQLAFAGLR